MHHPKELFVGYKYLKSCRLVKNKAVDEEALVYFLSFLNSAQPNTAESVATAATIHSLYNCDRKGFMRLIRNNPKSQCLILWTAGRAITEHFEVQDLIYLNWKDGKYTIRVLGDGSEPTEGSSDAAESAVSSTDSAPALPADPPVDETDSDDVPEGFTKVKSNRKPRVAAKKLPRSYTAVVSSTASTATASTATASPTPGEPTTTNWADAADDADAAEEAAKSTTRKPRARPVRPARVVVSAPVVSSTAVSVPETTPAVATSDTTAAAAARAGSRMG